MTLKRTHIFNLMCQLTFWRKPNSASHKLQHDKLVLARCSYGGHNYVIAGLHHPTLL